MIQTKTQTSLCSVRVKRNSDKSCNKKTQRLHQNKWTRKNRKIGSTSLFNFNAITYLTA